MVNENGNDDGGILAMAAKLAALVIVIGVPTAVLALLMPQRAADILHVAVYAVFAASALMAGASWSQPSYTWDIRLVTLAILAAVIFANPIRSFFEYDQTTYDFLRRICVRGAFVLVPFLVGRFLYWFVKRRISTGPKDLFS